MSAASLRGWLDSRAAPGDARGLARGWRKSKNSSVA